MAYEDYDDEYAGGRPLWGRIGVFVLLGLLFFLLGRCTAGGASTAELEEARQQAADLSRQNEELRQAQEAAVAGGGTGASPSPGATEDATEEDGDTSGDGQETYTVEAGDTLGSIAEEVYGDSQLYTLIVEANDLDSGNVLQQGQELIIPPNPDGDSSGEDTSSDEGTEEPADEES